MDLVFVYITVGSTDEARRIARTLVEERLAAGVNMLDCATSIYRWNGAVEQASEVVLIAKTRTDRFDRLAARIRELHSYQCPCILMLPIAAGDTDYLDWIR